MPNIQLAISPLTWTNDDMPSLGGDIALETCWNEMREAGFSGTEMGAKYPRQIDVLLPLLEKHRLRLASGWCSGNLMKNDVETEWRAIAPHVALVQAAGVKAMVYGEVSNTVHGDITMPLSRRVHLSKDQFQRYGERLTGLADRLLAETGMRIAFHHHVGTIVETAGNILQLLDVTGDAVGLTYDTGHAFYGGADPVALLEACAHRVAHVHFKDVRANVMAQTRQADASFLSSVLDGAFTVPGDGNIDFAQVLAKLSAVQYSGWIVVEAEQDPAKAHPLMYAKLAHKNLSQYLTQGGYTARGDVWEK